MPNIGGRVSKSYANHTITINPIFPFGLAAALPWCDPEESKRFLRIARQMFSLWLSAGKLTLPPLIRLR
jgi:hypothetical protein